MKEPRFKKALRNTGLIIAALIIVGFTVLCSLWVISLRDVEKLAAFQAWIDSLGAGGWLVLLLIQYVQIVLAFIPGGPIQIVAGALYGPLGGFFTCFVGTVAATCTVFPLVRRFGQRIVPLFVDSKDISRYKFLQDEKKLEGLVVLLFFIPGTPKDALTYLFALTSLSMRRFMTLSIPARLPAMLTSVLAGDSIAEGNWLRALIYFVAISAVAVIGFFVQRKVMALYKKRKR